MTSKERFNKLLEDCNVENNISDDEYNNHIDDFYLTIESYLENYRDYIDILTPKNNIYNDRVIRILDKWLFKITPKQKTYINLSSQSKLKRKYLHSNDNFKRYEKIKSNEIIVGSIEIDCKYGVQEILLVKNNKNKYRWKLLNKYNKLEKLTPELFYDMLMEVCF